MRRRATVSGILLILSIIDFTLAAPVLVQEKRQTYIDVAHLPRDVITVLEKRGSELEKTLELFGTLEKPIESSDAHAPPSSLPPETGHGPTDAIKAPAPNPAPSPVNPDPLESQMSPPSTASSNYEWLYDGNGEPLVPIPTSPESGSGHKLAEAGTHVAQPDPNPGPSTGPDENFPWEFWSNWESPPRQEPAFPKEFGQGHGNQVGYILQTTPGPLADPNFDWWRWVNYRSPPRPGLDGNQAGHMQQPNAGPSADANPEWDDGFTLDELLPPPKRPKLESPEELGQAHADQLENVQEQNTDLSLGIGTSSPRPPNTGLPIGSPEEPGDEADLQAARYAAKGKAKELRHVPGTARDVGNAAQAPEGVAAL